jgi:hypothetical protein
MNVTDRDRADLFALEKEIADLIRRATLRAGGIESGVAAFACVRVARAMLDRYPEQARVELTAVATQFLEHVTTCPSSLIQ